MCQYGQHVSIGRKSVSIGGKVSVLAHPKIIIVRLGWLVGLIRLGQVQYTWERYPQDCELCQVRQAIKRQAIKSENVDQEYHKQDLGLKFSA